MTPELPTLPALPALPVRRRETLEIFDTALKLYRRYFWVLLGWSALTSLVSLLPFVGWLLWLLTFPLLYGAISCCVAAAVRGQRVRFAQCWTFTKPRYGAILGSLFLSYLILLGIFLAIYVGAILAGLLGALVLRNAPEPLQILGGITGAVLLLVAFSVLGAVSFAWMNMVPIVVCLEDDKRSSAAIGRAFDLLRGNWRRVFGLALILGLAVMAVFAIIVGVYALFGFVGMSELWSSNPSESALWGVLATASAFMGLFFLLWNPAQSLVVAVLYLDLRVRREALDLEWTAYASAPAPTSLPATSPVDFLNPGVELRAETPSETPSPDLDTAPAPASFAPTSLAAGTGSMASQNPAETPLQNQPETSFLSPSLGRDDEEKRD